MNRSLETRLRRIEQRRGAAEMRATLIYARPYEDIAERAAAAGYRAGWPLLVIRIAEGARQ